MKAGLLVVLALAVLAGCEEPALSAAPSGEGAGLVDAAQAQEIARAFVVAGQPSGTVFHEFTTGEPSRIDGRWRVQVDAVIDYPPPDRPGSQTAIHYLIDVDANTGHASIFAQG